MTALEITAGSLLAFVWIAIWRKPMPALPNTSAACARLRAASRAALAQWLLAQAMKADAREVISTVAAGVADAEKRLGVEPGSYARSIR